MVTIIELDGGITNTKGIVIGTPANGYGFTVLPFICCPVEVRWDWKKGVVIETVII